MLGLVAVLSLMPSSSLPDVSHNDKVAHFIAYFALSFSFGIGLPRVKPVWVIIALALFGVGIEMAQFSMGYGRSLSFMDMLANLGGIATAALLIKALLPRSRAGF